MLKITQHYRVPTDSEFQWLLRSVTEQVRQVEGWLTPREIEFLAILGAYPKAEGTILEIGSYRGRSTIVLARAAAMSDHALVHAVDPLENWGSMIADQFGKQSARALLEKNISEAQMSKNIIVHQMYSYALAPNWKQPLRLLWIDGDHSYQGALRDFEDFTPQLASGGIVAFHDVMTTFECGRVFLDKVVKSTRFNKVGICGSIGWGQDAKGAALTTAEITAKQRLATKLERVETFDKAKLAKSVAYRIAFKMNRWMVKHGPMGVNEWRQVA